MRDTADNMATYNVVTSDGVAGYFVATLSYVNSDCILGNKVLDDGRRGCYGHIHWDSG